jgi:hypothetical protein
MWKRIKKWWKRKTPKHKPITLDELLSAPMYDPGRRGVTACRDKFSKLNQPEPELPKTCPQCGSTVAASRIDDRVVGCRRCNIMFMTKEAHDDPNIQRDITHANAGVTPKQRKIIAGGPIDQGMVSEAIQHIRDREIENARMFGEGYTRGKYGMSRAEYNATAEMNVCCWKCHKHYTVPRPEKTSMVTCVCPDCGDEFDTEIHGMRENLENKNEL